MFDKLSVITFFTILKHLNQKPLQLFLMIVGLTTATALWNSVHFINKEAKAAYYDAQIISDMSAQKILLSEKGEYFKLNGKTFVKGKKLRTRFECEDANTGKKYRVLGLAEVKRIEN